MRDPRVKYAVGVDSSADGDWTVIAEHRPDGTVHIVQVIEGPVLHLEAACGADGVWAVGGGG